MTSILLFGGSGQIGRALRLRLDATSPGKAAVDLENPFSILRAVGADHEVVINAAAWTDVDGAETHRDAAFSVNGDAVGAMGKASATNDVLVVHYSTDYVFDGTKTTAYRESDDPNPLSVYGESKRRGEQLLIESGARAIILRTSWVFAPLGRNFALTILRLARECDTLDVVADQIGAPTSAELVAEVTGHILRSPTPGLYHLTAAGETSWHGYAQYLVGEALAAGADLRLRPQSIRPIASADYPQAARRPLSSRLDTQKLRDTYGVTLPHWQDGVRELIKTLKTEGRL